MKKLALVLFVFFVAMSAHTFAQTASTPLKIGYVNSEVIFQQLPEAIKAKGELEAYSNMIYDKLDSMNQALQQDYAEYKKQSATMPEAKRNEKEQKLVAQQQAMEEFRRGAQNEIMGRQEKVMKPVKEKIIKTIELVAKDENMLFVFDKPEQAILLYADATFDITFKVLDKMKRGK